VVLFVQYYLLFRSWRRCQRFRRGFAKALAITARRVALIFFIARRTRRNT
jgi:hypothetical protein